MTLLDFNDTTLQVVQVETPVPVITARVSQRTAYLARSEESWDWKDLRDYVVAEIERRLGKQPRNEIKEKAIFESFLSRWGNLAPQIAKYAFDICDGKWKGSPIRVTRFCKGSDTYFAQEIANYLKA